MQISTGLLALLALGSRHVLAHDDDDDDMAPLGFMWPTERTWDDDHGMTAPCGSDSRAGLKRTLFPTAGGLLSLDGKQKVYDLQLSVSFSQDPKSNSDFSPILSGIESLNLAHACIPIPAITAAQAGRNATLQLKYIAEWHDDDHSHKRHAGTNETFYSCADITFVEQAQVSLEIPCFNATAEEHEDHEFEHGHDDDDHDDDHDDEHNDGENVKKGGLSGQAIAGIVIGCVAAVAGVALVGFYLWRQDRREKQFVRSMTTDVKL
ncbi:hypothetical protein QBC34DRAFT_479807 [Podospora aff. communis PSN243]|uniref:Copper acquisition factor BIM1-like domain-containing protein n=1 Tax=Podospora aff. communis PSN243 TaxID=3040156 RepID=A0AAV9G2L3_9PEZI|nr:hypothetical protein QBC34DRAFT_479807 [Podospora aff. communis PSN243]